MIGLNENEKVVVAVTNREISCYTGKLSRKKSSRTRSLSKNKRKNKLN